MIVFYTRATGLFIRAHLFTLLYVSFCIGGVLYIIADRLYLTPYTL